MKLSDVRRRTRDAGTRWFVVLLRVALAIAALWALRRELHDVHADALMAQVRAYGWSHLALAVISTTGSFLLLGVVELLAVRHADNAAKTHVSVGAAFGTGFVANAMSQSVGIALLTGAAVRARAYARYEMDAVAIAQVTAFVTLTATIGLLGAGAAALLATSAPVVIGTTTIAVRPWGVLLGCIVLAYLAWSILGKRDSIGRGRWQLARPSPAMATTQILLSVIDWLLAGMVLYAFMPTSAGLSVATVLSAYLIAQTVAVTSHIPAGAGIFEVAVLALITRAAPAVDRSAVVAALVMFRVVFYVAPLLIATVVAAVVELSRSHGRRAQLGDASYTAMGKQRAS
jgi:phosphatidylglycerol lysyltransferase